MNKEPRLKDISHTPAGVTITRISIDVTVGICYNSAALAAG
ncbi:MAG: hypothetical protein ACPL7O_09830 [Armatimonadota bacterium]